MEKQVRTKKIYKQDNSDRKQVRFGDLLPLIQNACDGNFSDWVKKACKEKLERDQKRRKI